jgi:hypothetical protein
LPKATATIAPVALMPPVWLATAKPPPSAAASIPSWPASAPSKIWRAVDQFVPSVEVRSCTPGFFCERASHTASRRPESCAIAANTPASALVLSGVAGQARTRRRAAHRVRRIGDRAIEQEQPARTAGELRLVAGHDNWRRPLSGVGDRLRARPLANERLVLEVGERRDRPAVQQREAAAVGLVGAGVSEVRLDAGERAGPDRLEYVPPVVVSVSTPIVGRCRGRTRPRARR